MKNMKHQKVVVPASIVICIVVLFAFVFNVFAIFSIQSAQASTFGINKNQDLINSLFSLGNAINANTKAIQDAQMQRRIDALNSDCVRQITMEIKERDTALKQLDQVIDKYINDTMNHMDMSFPENAAAANAVLNPLYSERAKLVDYYLNLLIEHCLKYTTAQTQQTNPVSVAQCSNKHAYPAGQDVWRPITIDSLCCPEDSVLNNDEQCVTNSQACKDNFGNNSFWSGYTNKKRHILCDCKQGFVWNSKFTTCITQAPITLTPLVTQTQKPVIKKEQEKSEQSSELIPPITQDQEVASKSEQSVIMLDIDDVLAKMPPEQNGVFSKLWTWLTGLFGA